MPKSIAPHLIQEFTKEYNQNNVDYFFIIFSKKDTCEVIRGFDVSNDHRNIPNLIGHLEQIKLHLLELLEGDTKVIY